MLTNNSWSSPSCLEPVAEEPDSGIDLCLSKAMNDQRTVERDCLKGPQVIVIVQDARACSLKCIIDATVLGVGQDDMLSQQVKCLV